MNIQDSSVLAWIHENRLVNEMGEPITFKDRLFMFDILADFSPNIVVKKASQIGGSLTFILKVLHLARSKLYRFNSIYTLPSDADVWEFVPTKVDKIISSNPSLRKDLSTDKVELKEFAGRFVHFKGTRSKTAPIMTTADLLVKDEKDRSDQNILSQYDSRTGASKWGWKWELSNPSVINAGVDLTWQVSDQKEWHVRCEGCKVEQVLRFDRNVDLIRGIFVCAGCKAPISDEARARGRWIPRYPGAKWSGYHVSQLMAPWISAKKVIEERDGHNDEYFQNFVLGEPYAAGDVEDFRQIILDCWTPNAIARKPYILGVDVGRIKHYVLGSPEGIFKVGRLETREELEDIIDRYNPITVMDAGPERTWAEEFRKKYPRLSICFFKRDKDRTQMVKWGEKEDAGVVWADRNRTIDAVVRDLLMGEILFDVPAADLEKYIKHWVNMVRMREEDALGRDRYVWDKSSESAPDHWPLATVYWWIARSRAHPAQFVESKGEGKQKLIVPDKMGGYKFADLEQYFDEKNS